MLAMLCAALAFGLNLLADVNSCYGCFDWTLICIVLCCLFTAWTLFWVGLWFFERVRSHLITRTNGSLIVVRVFRLTYLLILLSAGYYIFKSNQFIIYCFQLAISLVVFGCSKDFARDMPDAPDSKNSESYQETL